MEFAHDYQEHDKTPDTVLLLDPAAGASLTEVSSRPITPNNGQSNPDEQKQGRKVSLKSVRKLRHTSSGGSSIGDHHHTVIRPTLRKRRQKSVRLRKNTESSEDLEEGAIPRIRKTVVLSPPLNDTADSSCPAEEDPDEDCALAFLPGPTSSRFSGSAARALYARSQSEVGPSPQKVEFARLASVIDQQPCRSSANDESDCDNAAQAKRLNQQQRGMSLKTRRRIASVRDYTSITDELECMIPSPIPDPSPAPISTPAIKIETETLHDAEETDYHLMETLIERR